MAEDWKRQLDRLHADLVRRDDPVARVTEAEAVDASKRYPQLLFRGPVFGLAAHDPRTGPHWRVVQPLADGTPQQARDRLNSLLWFQARDEADGAGTRRALLAAVSLLDQEPVNGLEVLGVRYRVIRADEFARCDDDGPEPPRPTDPEPFRPSWDRKNETPSPDRGFVLDAGREVGLMAGAMRLGLRDYAYTGSRYPQDVRQDSRRAVTTHPDIVLLPVGFGVIERTGRRWLARGSLMPTPHDARRLLYEALTETWPLLREFNARQRAVYAKAAEEFKAVGRAHEVRAGAGLFRICRVERLVRTGPDGPEPPRPSDPEDNPPMRLHPTMDEDGTIHPDE